MLDRPEEKLAARLIEKHKLTPPFDLYQLVNHYATVEELDVPWDIDGITLFLKVSRKRPHIIINRSIVRRRKRFTLAHELGHVIIPWHIGNIVDTSDFFDRSSEYNRYESEAHRFAAELLMPTAWVNQLAEEIESPAEILQTVVREADVSPPAACIKLINALPPGYIYAEVDENFEVISSGRSKSTTVYEPTRSSSVSHYNETYQFASAFPVKLDSHHYVWWKLNQLRCPVTDEDPRSWREVLDQILEDIAETPSEKLKFKQRVNGFLAAANDKVRGTLRTRDSLFSACLHKLSDQPFLRDFVGHDDFLSFLGKRVEAFLGAS